MTKIIQFSNECYVLYSREQSVDSGSPVPHKQCTTHPEGFGARVSGVAFRRGNVETRALWLARRSGFSYKASGPYFLG